MCNPYIGRDSLESNTKIYNPTLGNELDEIECSNFEYQFVDIQKPSTKLATITCREFYLYCSLLIASRPCSVINTKCTPNIICQSLLKEI